MVSISRIVVLDQDANTRKLLTAALEDDDCGAEIIAAHGASEALVRLKAPTPVDLVVVDPAIPSPWGWDLISELRRTAVGVPILVVSVMQTEQSMARSMELGADDYLLKPIDLNEYRRTVARMLMERRELLALAGSQEDRNVRLTVRSAGQGMLVEVNAPTWSMHVSRFERFVNRLVALSLTNEEALKLRLALDEIITNAKEWGNRGDSNKMLKLSYCLLSDRVTIRIEDEGEGFVLGDVPDPTLDPLDHVKRRKLSGKRIGGWGILLARKAMDEVAYNPKGNVVVLTKFLRKPTRP